MADLIDRQAAIDDLQDMYHAAEKWGKGASDDVIKARAESCMASLIEMKLRIEKLPSAEPRCYLGSPCEYQNPEIKIPMPTAEPKTGRWMFPDPPIHKPICSECRKPCIGLHAFAYALTDYCPNCGAKMEGVENGSD